MSAKKNYNLFARQALLADGWMQNALVSWDETGTITNIASGQNPGADKVDVLIPGMANLHCHSFQRAMAAMAEMSQSKSDSFWSWRKLMYRFVHTIAPEHLHDIACLAYMEMLESGFTSVGEFHYLHHQINGNAFDDPAEMSHQIIAAAADTGMDLTLLPVFYAHSGFGGKAPSPQQYRFIHDVDGFLRLLQQITSHHKDIVLGMAPHSLRAVTPDQLYELLTARQSGPIHIHAAEQQQEVKDCMAALGVPPVRWLLDNVDISPKWCLVHATHMQDDEIRDMARSGAIAGLCPVTEANLGDGIFDGASFLSHNGQIGIGSDSCVRIELTEELRLLEYGQRLRDQARAVLAPVGKSVGGNLFRQAAIGGAVALQQNSGTIAPGKRASFVSLDMTQTNLSGRKMDAILDGWIFSCQRPAIEHVWVSGTQMVKNGYHKNHEAITRAYKDLLKKILHKDM